MKFHGVLRPFLSALRRFKNMGQVGLPIPKGELNEIISPKHEGILKIAKIFL